jgi:hypothetical protein
LFATAWKRQREGLDQLAIQVEANHALAEQKPGLVRKANEIPRKSDSGVEFEIIDAENDNHKKKRRRRQQPIIIILIIIIIIIIITTTTPTKYLIPSHTTALWRVLWRLLCSLSL